MYLVTCMHASSVHVHVTFFAALEGQLRSAACLTLPAALVEVAWLLGQVASCGVLVGGRFTSGQAQRGVRLTPHAALLAAGDVLHGAMSSASQRAQYQGSGEDSAGEAMTAVQWRGHHRRGGGGPPAVQA